MAEPPAEGHARLSPAGWRALIRHAADFRPVHQIESLAQLTAAFAERLHASRSPAHRRACEVSSGDFPLGLAQEGRLWR
jgi:hypothetical protein